jgi:hypothetical protein
VSEAARLVFLVEIVELEATHLETTTRRLFDRPFDAQRAVALKTDIDDAERTDAFVARFARLQDTVGDKLLPAALTAMAERVGPAIDNLDRAEKLGLLPSADEWMAARRLRNRMVHEYVRDPALLAEALNQGRLMVPMLTGFSRRLVEACRQRGLLSR